MRGSLERILEFADFGLPWSLDLLAPRAQAADEGRWPFVDRLQDDTPTLSMS